MKGEFNNIDQLLRNTLSDYKKNPGESVWERLTSRLSGLGLTRKLINSLFWVAIALIIIAPITWIYFVTKEPDVVPVDKTNFEFPNTVSPVEIGNAQNEVYNSTLKSEKHSIKNSSGHKGGQAEMVSNISHGNNTSVNIELKQTEADVVTEENKGYDGSSSEPVVNDRDTYLLDGYFPFLIKGTFTGKFPVVSFVSDFLPSVLMRHVTYNWPANDNWIYTKDDYGKKGNWIYGFSIVPEVIIPGTEKAQKGISVELTGRHTIGEFSIEGGFGLNVSEDDGRFKIDYEQYDSIAYYYKVTSFTIDEETGKPTFNTDMETVYDTVGYTTSANPKNSYTYLYFPFYAGLEVSRFNRLSLHVNAGLIYSIMIGKNESAVTYQNDKATSIIIENNTPARITSQMLLAGSLGLHYQFSNNAFLNLEPIVKYYFKPLYENRYNPGTTYSLGLRTGLYFKF